MGLLGELKKYVKDAMPGGLLNPEVSSQGILDGAALSTTPVPVIGDLLGLGADLHRYKNEPESRTLGNFALSGLGMLPFVPAMTAWHGSPHKFDKFSLDKIGTGEGAQAYGHGLYLAENPGVAAQYRDALAVDPRDSVNQIIKNVKQASSSPSIDDIYFEMKRHPILKDFENSSDFKKKLLDVVKGTDADGTVTDSALRTLQQLDRTMPKPDGQLYKTDIPDEAVARFLDWDKPLSQQAPEVLESMRIAREKAGLNNEYWKPGKLATAAIEYKKLADVIGADAATNALNSQGVKGIRYLDGGSRSAGQGSSNFVAFDPELIRILERNGQPTGLEPWKPGEWQGLLGR